MSTDETIILAYKKSGNKRLLSPLFKKYNDKLFGLAYYYLHNRESAIDTVMEAYEVVLKSIDSKEITYYKGWVQSICRNICLKKIRDDKKFEELAEISDDFMESDTDPVYNDETIDNILELLPQLKEKQHVCVKAFYLESQSYEDIANNYGMTFKEVKSAIQNGKRNLKLMFEKKLD
ncbi:MAG: sigma-70 family RNA polymerase sigma factor [Saprospiraceae bacterium]